MRHHRYTPLQLEKLKTIAWLKSPESEKAFPAGFRFSREELAKFEATFKGKVVYPGSPGYNEDRKEFDDLYPAFPQLIVYVANNDDIKECIDLARKYGLDVAVRSGGHSLGCFSVCDGIVIDMSTQNNIHVDTTTNTAVIESGANFDMIEPKVEQYGLHLPTGDCPTVCIAGFMMGGGYSITSRQYGMNCDNVLEVTVMLADKQIVAANENQNKDLFWAIRGGTGGNFGVLLSVKYQLYPLGDIYGVQMRWPIDAQPNTAAQVLYAIQENYLVDGAYPQLGIETILCANPQAVKTLFFCATWIGDLNSFKNALAPLLAINGYTSNSYQGKYSHVNEKVLDGTPPDLPEDVMAFSRSAYISRNLTQQEWFEIAQYFYNTAPNKYTMIDMEAYGGKINQFKEDYNAFIHRNAKCDLFVDAFFDKQTNDRKQNEEWTENLFKFLTKYTDGHSYQNYVSRNQEDFREAYWGKYYNQLVLIKQKYDPANFFNYQQSIGPDIILDPKQVTIFKPSPIVYEPH